MTVDLSYATGCAAESCGDLTSARVSKWLNARECSAAVMDPANVPALQALAAARLPGPLGAFNDELAALLATTLTPTAQQVRETCAKAYCMLSTANACRLMPGQLWTRYDYSSVMHYGFDGCMRAAAGAPLPVPPSMPGSSVLSVLDVEAACQAYECGVKVELNGAAHLTAAPAGMGEAPMGAPSQDDRRGAHSWSTCSGTPR